MLNSARTLIAAGLVTVAMAGVASAEVLMTASRKNPATGAGTAFSFVALNDGGSFTVGFNSTAGTTVVITYNAECSRTGPKGYVGLQVIVDGKVAQPRVGKDFVLCSTSDKVSVSRQVFIDVATNGFQNVNVKAAALGGATGWRLDDSTIVAQD